VGFQGREALVGHSQIALAGSRQPRLTGLFELLLEGIADFEIAPHRPRDGAPWSLANFGNVIAARLPVAINPHPAGFREGCCLQGST
jgi:hypothetical protein